MERVENTNMYCIGLITVEKLCFNHRFFKLQQNVLAKRFVETVLKLCIISRLFVYVHFTCFSVFFSVFTHSTAVLDGCDIFEAVCRED